MAFFQISIPATRRAAIRAELPTAHPAGLDQVGAAICTLQDPDTMSSHELAASMATTARLRNQLDAYLSSLADTADRIRASRTLRAGTTGTLIATATGATPAAGSAIAATARALRGLPQVQQAYQAGALSAAHVAVITRAAASLPGFTAVEPAITALAATTDPLETRRVLEVIADQVNPTSGELDAAEQAARRNLHLSARPSGMWRISGLLDDLSGSKLADLLASFTTPPDTLDTTTSAQRRADALNSLADAAAANTRPLGVSAVNILVDLDHLDTGTGAHLPDGTLLTRAQYQAYTCAAAISIILGIKAQNTFVPLALGRTQRRASAAQWAALTARDRGCIRCGRPPRYCHAHHIIGWASGGFTDLSNLCLLCPRCHNDLHHGNYTITVDQHGTPTITPTNRPPP